MPNRTPKTVSRQIYFVHTIEVFKFDSVTLTNISPILENILGSCTESLKILHLNNYCEIMNLDKAIDLLENNYAILELDLYFFQDGRIPEILERNNDSKISKRFKKMKLANT